MTDNEFSEEMEELTPEQSDDLAAEPSPVFDRKYIGAMVEWGFKKRKRYGELLEGGYSPKEAFGLVEFHQGQEIKTICYK